MNLFQLATSGIDLESLPSGRAPAPVEAAPEPSPAFGRKVEVPAEIDSIIQEAAATYGVDPNVVRGVAFAESGFDPDVISGKRRSSAGAVGLMQFMPATAKELDIDPLNVREAIFGGAYYLRKNLDKFDGDYGRAVAAYNWGPNRDAFQRDDWFAAIPKETDDYVKRVFAVADSVGADPEPEKSQQVPLPSGVAPSNAGGGRGSVSPGMINTKMPRTAVPDMTVGGVARDVASGLLQIGPTAVKGVGELARLVSGDNVGKGLTDFADRGNKAIQEVVGSERAQAQRQNFAADMADDGVSIGQALFNNKGAMADMALPQLGSMLIPVGVAGAAGKAATVGKAAQVLDKAALASRVAAAQQAAGIGATAAQNAASTFAELVDKGVSLKDAYLGAGITVPFSVIAGKLTGGGAEGALIRSTLGDAVKKGATEVPKAMLREGGQEVGEELGQALGEAVGTGKAPTATATGKRLAVAGVLGGLMGGGVDIATQAMAPRVEAQPTTPQVPVVTKQEPTIDVTYQTADGRTVTDVVPGNTQKVKPDTDQSQSVDNIAQAILEAEAKAAQPAAQPPTGLAAELEALRARNKTSQSTTQQTTEAADAAPATGVPELGAQAADDSRGSAPVADAVRADADGRNAGLPGAPAPSRAELGTGPDGGRVDGNDALTQPLQEIANAQTPTQTTADTTRPLPAARPAAVEAAGVVPDVDPTTRRPAASWVIRDKATGQVVMETPQKAVANKINPAKYEAVPIGQHLASLSQTVTQTQQTDGATTQSTGAQTAPAARTQVQAEGSATRLGRDNTPLTEGGQPFKTRKAAGDAKKLQPMMRVVKVDGGYALAEKTPAQIAAMEKAAQRLRNANTSPAGEPIPAHSFIAAAGGMQAVTRNDMGVDGNPRVGNRRLFAGAGRGLSIEQATQMLIADGYLAEGASQNDAYALIKKSLTHPQYNATGYEQMAEMDAAARFDDYLAAQEEAALEGGEDPFGMANEFTTEELEDVGYTDADPALQAEVAALITQAEAIGIDTFAILEDIARTYANATQDQYNAAAREAIAAAIARGNQDGGSAAAQAAPAVEPAADQGLDQPEALELASQTPAEAAAQQEAQEQAAKAEAARQRAADAQAARDEERKRIAQASVRAADTFELGQDPLDSLTGQEGLKFSRGPAAEVRNLVTLHNLTEDNLRYADSLGGIPVPSIGITKVDSPFGGFGSITLIAPKDMIDPKAGVPVYDRDAWTARFPTMNFKKVKAKMADAFYERMKPVRELMAGDDGGFVSALWEQLRNASTQSPEKVIDIFTRYEAGRVLYAKEVLGKSIKVPTKAVAPREFFAHEKPWLEFVSNTDWSRGDLSSQDLAYIALRKEAGAAAVAAAEAFIDKRVAARTQDPQEAARLRKSYAGLANDLVDDSGMLAMSAMDRARADARTVGAKEVDKTKLAEAVDKAVKRDDPGYLRWVQSLVQPLFEAPTITLRGKEVPATLDNIVSAMTVGATAGVEKSMTFSPGKVAAMLGKRFKSLDEIKAARDRVVSQQAESESKNAADALLTEYRTHVGQFYTYKDWRGNIDTWAANDDSMEALAKAGKLPPSDANIRAALARMGFKGVDQQALDLARNAIDALRNAATDYFEAKPQRAVSLSEFKGAVVPKGTSAEAIAILEKHGIAVELYSKTEGAREKAIQKLAKRLDKESGGVLFSFAGENRRDAGEDANAAPDVAAIAQPLRTPATTIRAAITKAYGNLLPRLESKGLVTLTQTEDEAIDAAARARADKTGQPLADVRASLMGSVSNSVATDTPAFERWFGDSKVVDADGKPLVVYHGTKADFSRFSLEKFGQTDGGWAGEGIYFAPNPDEASLYATSISSPYGNSTGANVMPVFLSAKNPLEWRIGRDGDRRIQNKRNELGAKEFAKWVQSEGYDSVHITSPDIGNVKGEDQWVVFQPEQIKSATGNNGNFDPNDLDIRRSANGAIQGFFDPQTGQSFLIADNLTAEAAPGVLMHEVGIHMAADGSMDALFNRAATMLKLQRGNPFIKAVQARMDAAGETSGEEAAAYIAEAYENDRANAPASVQRWVTDLLAAVKAWMFKKGIMGADRLTVADIAAVARANARSMAQSDGQGGVQLSQRGPGPLYSNAGNNPPPIPTSAQNGLFNTPPWQLPEATHTDKLIYELQDGRVDLKRVQEAIAATGKTIAEGFDARLAETLLPGRVARRTETFLTVEAKPLLEAMAKNNVSQDELSDYLLARHAPERNAQVAKVNPDMPDGGAGTNSQGVLMTTQAARDHIAALTAGKRTALELLARQVDAITAGTRDILVREGLEKQETIDAWMGAYKHYVPLFKDESMDTMAHPMGSGLSVTGSASRRATGSTGEVTNMLAHVLMQRETAITRAEKNRAAMSLYGLALTNPNAEMWTTIRPSMPADQIADELVRMGVDPMEAEVGMQGVPTIRGVDPVSGKVVDRPNPMYKRLDNALTVKVNGEDRVILFNAENERAMRLVRNLKNQDGVLAHIDWSVGTLSKLLAFSAEVLGASKETQQKVFDKTKDLNVANATRYFASINTQYNPAFGMVNVIRDVGGALVNLSDTALAGKQARVLSDSIPAAIGIARDLRGDAQRTPWSDLWQQFQDDGGRTGYRDLFTDPYKRAEAVQSELDKLSKQGTLTPGAAAHAVLDLLDDFNTTLENGVRLSAYKAALDQGLSRAEAARLARELTLDFNRKGRAGRELGPLFAFFNASVQGTARTLKALQGPAGKRILIGGVGLGVMQALMLAAAGFDDDEIPDFVKARALIIPMPGKQYIAIPLQFGLNALPNTGRVATELLMSGGKDWAEKSFNALGELAGSFNPLGGGNIFTGAGLLKTVAPTVVDPIVDMATNTDFTGKPIGKERMPWDTRPGFAMARESTQRAPTGQAYVGISKAINSLSGGNDYARGLASPSPEQVRYVFTTLGGGVYRELEKVLNASLLTAQGETLKAREVPFGSRFAGEVEDADVQRGRYFKNNARLEKLEAQLKGLSKEGRGEELRALVKDNPEIKLYELNNQVSAELAKLNKLAAQSINDRETLKRIDEARTQYMRALNDRMRELEKAATKAQ